MDIKSPSSPRSDADWYRLPFELVRDATAAIIPSAKLRAGGIDHNRYYVDLASLGLDQNADRIAEIASAMLLPKAAWPVLDEAFAHFGHLRFVGVGPSRGRITYRLYVGWGAERREADHTATAIDWHPGDAEFFTKRYGRLGRLHHRDEVAHIRRCLRLDDPGVLTDPSRADVGAAAMDIISQARGDLLTNTADEPDSPRRSVSFNYNFVAYTENADIAPQLSRLAQTLGIPASDMARWRTFSDPLRLLDVAVGTGSDGSPFVTFYHGLLREPPDFVDMAQDDFEAAQRAVRPAATPTRLACPTPALAAQGGLEPSDDGRAPPVFALGQLAVYVPEDFPGNPSGRAGLLSSRAHQELASDLRDAPDLAEHLHWILMRRQAPAYVIRPQGAFAMMIHDRLCSLLDDGGSNRPRIALPGRLVGKDHSMAMSLPALSPQLSELRVVPSHESLPVRCKAVARKAGPLLAAIDGWISVNVDNAGRSALDRAVNAALAMDAQTGLFTQHAVSDYPALHAINARPVSDMGPAQSDLVEVDLTFFDPVQKMRRIGRAHIDTSTIAPRLAHGPNFWSQP